MNDDRLTNIIPVVSTIITSIISAYFMHVHILTLIIPPVTVVMLVFYQTRTFRGNVLRSLGAILSLAYVNASIILVDAPTLPESLATDDPFGRITHLLLVFMLPKAVWIAFNVEIAYAWWLRRYPIKLEENDDTQTYNNIYS